MPEENFADATLVLVAHGSLLSPESAAPAYQHADDLRRRNIFDRVIEGFWKQEPCLAAVLRGAFSRRVFIVPLFISEGYFTEEVIPREMGLRTSPETDFARVQKRGEQTLYYCAPVGTHPSMTSVILARAAQIVQRYPFPRAPKPSETALFIAGHGTTANENSRAAIDHQVNLIRDLNIYAEVHGVFMEEAPHIVDCQRMTACRNMIVVPFFISDGLHSQADIPEMLGESGRIVQMRLKAGQPTWRNPTEKKGKLIWYTGSVGNASLIADVILERVREADRSGSGL